MGPSRSGRGTWTFKIRVFIDNSELGLQSETPGSLIIVFFLVTEMSDFAKVGDELLCGQVADNNLRGK